MKLQIDVPNFQMLKIAGNKCHRLLQLNRIKELETCLKIIKERLEELGNFKSKVQEFMLQKDESIEHIQEW